MFISILIKLRYPFSSYKFRAPVAIDSLFLTGCYALLRFLQQFYLQEMLHGIPAQKLHPLQMKLQPEDLAFGNKQY